MRERLSFYGKLVFWLCFGFFLVSHLFALVTGLHRVPFQSLFGGRDLCHLGACAALFAIWRLPRLPSICPFWVDRVGTFLTCAFYAGSGYFQELTGLPGVVAPLAVTHTLVARSVFVPSKPWSTMRIAIVASVPGVVIGAVQIQQLAQRLPEVNVAFSIIMLTLWFVVGIAVSTVNSRVIFGLRTAMKEARKLGQYTLEEKIGAGGMGEVYKASHAFLRRPTAVKLLNPASMDATRVARFEREVQMTARLTHPNTIAIYDYGRTPDGVFYYAMEYLDGLTLDQLIKEDGPQRETRTVHILRQVCASLAEAHDVGLIHRDIKGANVILCERGGMSDVAKVVDFGLVKDLSAMGGADAALSGISSITGTPLYLSPEAIQNPQKVDARSDIYSVGVLAYHLLTGQHVFDGKNFVDICSKHLHVAPIPPSERVGRAMCPQLEATVLRCLEKDPTKRPATARELLLELSRTHCKDSWTDDEARAWWLSFRSRKTDGAKAVRADEPTRVLEKKSLAVTAVDRGDLTA